jgi:hypothetical protein
LASTLSPLIIKTLGLFRVCGDVREVKELKGLYIHGHVSIRLADKTDSPDVVASLLKRFFFELPIPLIEFSAFQGMISALDQFEIDNDEVGVVVICSLYVNYVYIVSMVYAVYAMYVVHLCMYVMHVYRSDVCIMRVIQDK